MKHVLALLLLALCSIGQAATLYVRQGAGGSNDGSDWNNAFTAMPTLGAGNVYYVADGSYTASLTCSVAGVTINKATIASHGTSTGWLDSYGDGQATFGTITVQGAVGGTGCSGLTIDGKTRNESDWSAGSAYGFKATDISSIDDFGSVYCAHGLTVRYVNLGAVTGTSSAGSEGIDNVLKGSGFRANCANWLVQRTFLHNITHFCLFCANGFDGVTVEYSRFQDAWGKEAIRGQIAFKNGVIRWNQFHNACGFASPDGCTAEIALWDGSAGNWDNNEIYGNTFYRSNGDENSGGTIVVGGNGTSWAGSPASNTLIYSNTIAGIDGGGSGGNILVNGGSGNVCRNNLWWDTISASVTCSTTSNNVDAGADPFVSYATGNLRLSAATAAGFTLSSPYNADMDGATRGSDGTFDVGAFEFVAGGGSAPNAPSNLRLLDVGGIILGLALLGSLLWRRKHGNRTRSPESWPAWGLGRVGGKEVRGLAQRTMT
jgi:hypothetical protein